MGDDTSARPARRYVLAVGSVLAATVLSLSVLGLPGGSGGGGRATDAPTSSTPHPCASADGLPKPVLTGLIGIGGVGDAGQVLDGATVNVRWAELQPVRGGALVHPNPIDDAIAEVGEQDGCRYLKLRVLTGVESPRWVKELAGPPVDLELTYDGRRGSIPRFWAPEVGRAYASLQRLLAEEYDDEPSVREVAISACTTFYAEPMLRQAFDAVNAEALVSAGYDHEVDARCQRAQLDAHLAWQRTASSYALNPYERIDSDGQVSTDPEAALDLARSCREVLGRRCVLANNSVRWPLLSGDYATVYAGMRELGSPLAYQLAAPGRIGDPVGAVRWTLTQGASSVEMVPGIASQHSAQLDPLGARMTAVP